MSEMPSRIFTADDAARALGAYADWYRKRPKRKPTPADNVPGPLPPPSQPWIRPRVPTPPGMYADTRRRDLVERLRVDPGPGPAVWAHPDGGNPYPVSDRPVNGARRSRYTVRVPAGEFGPVIRQPLAELDALTFDVQFTRACAARAAQLSSWQRENGRGRQSAAFADEAQTLRQFAGHLEQTAMPVIGAVWLNDWRQLAARYGPTLRPAPPMRPAQLRNAQNLA